MNITVKLFAAARDALGQDTIEVSVDNTPPTVAGLRKALSQNHPELTDIVAHSLFAIDEEYRTDAAVIPPHATVACIPPVSGG